MTTQLDLRATLLAAQRKLAKRADPDAIASADRLRRVLAGDFSPPDGETPEHALCYAALAVIRCAPPDVTEAQLRGVLLSSAGALQGRLDAIIADARAAASAMQPILATPRRDRPATSEVDEDEFVIEHSGKRIGKPVDNAQHNLSVAMHKLGVRLRFDLFARRKLITLPADGEGVNHEQPFEDHHAEDLAEMCESMFGFYPPRERFLAFLGSMARHNQYHPVLDYLDRLREWDGISRVETWLINAGAPDTPYVRAVSRLVLVAAVRRVRQPGCKFDEMLVLETPEHGKDKSTALRTLCPDDEWFTDDFSFTHVDDTKKMLEQTAGRWIVEAGELSGLSNKEVAAVKQYLSRREDTARKAYGREPERCRRQFIVIGTVNEEQYLRDATGNRRFWPVRVKRFDVPWLRANRDQLWAEASHLDLAHPEESYIRLDPSLYDAARVEQEQRKVADSFVVVLEELLGNYQGRIKAREIWRVLGMHDDRLPNKHDVAQINSALRSLNFEYKRVTVGGVVTYYYQRGSTEERAREIVLAPGPGGFRVVPPAAPN